jgi:hypothetical protein
LDERDALEEKAYRLQGEENALFQQIRKLAPEWKGYHFHYELPARQYVGTEGHDIKHCRLCSSIINKLKNECWQALSDINRLTSYIDYLQQEYERTQMEQKAKFEKVVIPDLDKLYGILGKEFEKYTNELPNIRLISSTWTTPAYDEQPKLRSCDTKKPSYKILQRWVLCLEFCKPQTRD